MLGCPPRIISINLGGCVIMSVSVNGFLKSECLALTEAVDFLARLGGGF